MEIQVEDPARGTLTVTHTTNTQNLDCYSGPLGRITIFNPAGPDAMFIAPSDEFIIMLAEFLQQFRGIQ